MFPSAACEIDPATFNLHHLTLCTCGVKPSIFCLHLRLPPLYFISSRHKLRLLFHIRLIYIAKVINTSKRKPLSFVFLALSLKLEKQLQGAFKSTSWASRACSRLIKTTSSSLMTNGFPFFNSALFSILRNGELPFVAPYCSKSPPSLQPC